ncbi:hypothetical protein QE250_16715 [Chromatiaceae bacterium AAb-1]|nr:hypothetical protein [Chromatiaceae bacterium AAb-1]
MLTKNLALSSIFCFTLAALTACGGGSDDSTPTTPGTGGTTNPGTGGGTTNPGTGGGTTPTPVNLEFASGIYIWQGSSSIYEIVVSDNSLYVLAPSLKPVLARVDNVNTFVKDKTITEATAVVKVEDDEVLKAGTISITFDDADDIKELSAMGITTPSLILTSHMTFSGVANITDLAALNGELAGTNFSAFAIDTGLNLTATDKYGCDIEGKLTGQSNDIFHAELNYTGASCADAATYEGTLWAYEHNSVTYLGWLAFNSDDTKLVTGRLDTKPVSLEAGAYFGTGNHLLISKGNKIYHRDFSPTSAYIFGYTPTSGSTVLNADGRVHISATDYDANASLELFFPGNDKEINATIKYEDSVGSEVSVPLENLAPVSHHDSIDGDWGTLSITSGLISGSAFGCDILLGTAQNYEGTVAEITLPCSNVPFTLTGVAVALTINSTKTLLIITETDDNQIIYGGLEAVE